MAQLHPPLRRPRRSASALVGRAMAIALLALTAPKAAPAQTISGDSRVLIVVVDGLRPDYITPEWMPRLNALADAGVRGLNHHAVFPTVTRVNSPSIFSGQRPGTHGLLGNTVYIPAAAADRTLDASDRHDLDLIRGASGGRILSVASLGEMLEAQGRVFFAASSGSDGSALLMNPTGAGAGLVHHDFTLPESLSATVAELLGPKPETVEGEPATQLVARAVDAILEIGIDRADADVLGVWLTEPDGTAHDTGIGSPATVKALAEVDEQIGRLIDGLDARGLLDRTDIMVTSDHGFSTRIGTQSLTDLLVEGGLKESRNSMDVVVAGDAIHVREGGEMRIGEIVQLLQRTDWVGAIFTRGDTPNGTEGHYPGTISFAAIGWEHARSADILVSGDWTDAPSEWGLPGTVLVPGIAGHGTASPWDIRATFVASGPDFKRGVRTEVPTGNIDLAPTAIFLSGGDVPAEMDGRVLRELITGGPAVGTVAVEHEPVSVTATTGYSAVADRLRVGTTVYLHSTSVRKGGGDGSAASVVWVAHRGGIVPGIPENTLVAYRNAIAQGVDAIEIDLRGTADREVVILHDAMLERTTNGSGPVGSLTLAEVRELDAGQGERVPTFAEVLDLVRGTPTRLLLDIKESDSLDLTDVIGMVQARRMAGQVIAGVRSLADLEAVHGMDGRIATLGFVAEPAEIDAFANAGVDAIRLWPEWMANEPGLVDRVRGLGLPVWVTAGDASVAQLRTLVEQGATGILSDWPERIVAARGVTADE